MPERKLKYTILGLITESKLEAPTIASCSDMIVGKKRADES
jgi:hypothetical protein